MLSLTASVASSVAVSVLLKVARGRAIEVDQAIATNYLVAALLCLALLRPELSQLLRPGAPWWLLLLLGLLLPSVFLAMAGAVRHAGIIVSDAAQRLSLLIPLAAAFFLFDEAFASTKLIGAAVALAALSCLIWPSKRDRASPTSSRSAAGAKTVALLLCVWVGYGTIDILFKQMARSTVDFSSSLLAAFVLAGLAMGSWLTIKRTVWCLRSIAAGVLLGVLNFSNIYFYLAAHQQYPDNPTLVFAAMNIGVISLGTLVGAWAFKESLGALKLSGVVLAVSSIALLIPR